MDKKGRLQLSCGFMTQITPIAPPKNKRSNVPLYFVFSGGNKGDCMVLLEQWLAFVLFHLSYHCERNEGNQKENIKAQQVQGWYGHSLEQSSSLENCDGTKQYKLQNARCIEPCDSASIKWRGREA